jgi:hypothetical protein
LRDLWQNRAFPLAARRLGSTEPPAPLPP